MNDTICAVSTAVGVGGIAIIRVSGDDSIKIVSSIFKGKDLTKVQSHTINYGHIVDHGEIVDEVLACVMLAPKTYTREDIVEIDIHGGIATTNRVLELLLDNGARLAEPGEFTKRAFLNGRIDLIEAEAVSDVINAENDNARSLSVNQLSGKLSDIIRNMRKKLLELEANIEVNIDYPEYEDIEEVTVSKVSKVLEEIKENMDKLIKESSTGKIIKNGIDVALIGKPNVGKSSILNALLEEDKAIVTDIAGTTRDIVEGKMILNGITINFIDTAGIRETDNLVEQIGVDKSLNLIEKSDLVIFVLASDSELSSDELELLEKIKNKKHIIFINKDDLGNSKKTELDGAIHGNTVNKSGLDSLKKAISDAFLLEELPKKDLTYISNARQLSLIKSSRNAIDAAASSLKNGMPVDMIEIDLTNARNLLGEIIGETYSEELIDELFSKFCLGK